MSAFRKSLFKDQTTPNTYGCVEEKEGPAWAGELMEESWKREFELSFTVGLALQSSTHSLTRVLALKL